MDEAMKIELKPQFDFESECEKIELEIFNPTDEVDARLEEIEEEMSDLEISIDKLTNEADKLDYSIAVASGVISGIIDILFVGKWDFASAKAWSNKEVHEQIINFAQQDPEYQKFIDRKRSVNEENRLNNAVEFLEGKYKLPGDREWKFQGSSITPKSHHLDDLCHHPTIVGLVCCVVVQFSGESIYSDSMGNPLNLPVTVNEYGKFVGRNNVEKMFAGIINWFLNVAQTAANRKGHLMSDMAGSYSSTKRKTEGMGLPGGFLSTMKELSALPIFKDSNFATNLSKAYQHGIGNGKNQIDLGAFNALFEGASSKFDMRTEMAIGHELKRQALPIVINEILVRACYFVRRLIVELKESDSLLSINWNNVIPFNNRTIERMMTIATGTFHAIDSLDAVIEGAIKAKNTGPCFWAEFGRQVVLRLNFVGVGRFTIALGTDAFMGLRKDKKSRERMLLKAESLYLLEAKMYYGESLMWSAVKDANQSIDSLYEAIQHLSGRITGDLKAVKGSIDAIAETDASAMEEYNQGLSAELLDIL